MEEETRSLNQRLRELEDEVVDNKRERKPFKVPFKARVGKKKIRDGWITILTINDNMNIDFTKEKIVDGTYKLKGDTTVHAIESKDVFFYKNKPIVFQPKKKINPYNPLKGEHETYGQKYVMARIEGDKLSLKKSIGWAGSIVGIVILGIIAYAFLTGGGG